MLTAERLRSLMAYDPETGIFVRLVSAGCRAAGSEVGLAHPSTPTGYVMMGVDGRLYKAHRLAWLYVYGEWPAKDLDHRDGNRANNAIGNLREATESQNAANSGLRRHNTSGFRGVSWNSRAGKWKAAIVVRGRTRHLGFFADAAEAGAVYEEAAAREFGEFARV